MIIDSGLETAFDKICLDNKFQIKSRDLETQ